MHGQAELIAIAAPKLCNGPDLVLLDKAVQEFSLVLCELAIRTGTRVLELRLRSRRLPDATPDATEE